MIYKALSFIACILLNQLAMAQADSTRTRQLKVISGFGNYEALYLGLSQDIQSSEYIELAVGIKPYGTNHENFYNGYISYGTEWRKKQTQKFIPSVHAKVIMWHLENASYKFLFLGVNPEFRLKVFLKDKLSIAASAGIIYNTMITYKRKTFNEVGWPKEFQPSFSIHLGYRIK